MKTEVLPRHARTRLIKCLTTVCDYWCVSASDVLGKSRKQNIVSARHSLRYFLTNYGDLTSASEDGSGAGTYTRAIFGGFRNPSISSIIEYCSPLISFTLKYALLSFVITDPFVHVVGVEPVAINT